MQPPAALIKRGIHALPCIGDGRQSGTSGSPSILNASPEAAAGGGLAMLKTGDRVRIDLGKHAANILISEAELASRRAELKKPAASPIPRARRRGSRSSATWSPSSTKAWCSSRRSVISASPRPWARRATITEHVALTSLSQRKGTGWPTLADRLRRRPPSQRKEERIDHLRRARARRDANSASRSARWSTRARPSGRSASTMTGRHVTLVPLDAERHADALFAAANGGDKDRLWTYLFDGPYADPAAFKDVLARARQIGRPAVLHRDRQRRAACRSAIRAFMRIEPAHRVIEIGNILYTPALQRTIGATEAQYLFAAYVFDTLGYRRYEWKCNALNAPSRRAALRLGFTFEGVFRQHMIVKGRNRDTAWFSMLDSEWPQRRAAFERWLSPENFDAAGRQRVSLASLNGARGRDAGRDTCSCQCGDAPCARTLQAKNALGNLRLR